MGEQKSQTITELVVISGKGGTGKTSLVASLAVCAGNLVCADCDVDASDLHLILTPTIRETHKFYSGHEAIIRQEMCTGCGVCHSLCRYDAVRIDSDQMRMPAFTIDHLSCEGCGVCVEFCPVQAIDFPECLSGEWMVSDTRCGPMVHARLGIAGENSGKLVATVRREARRIAEEKQISLIIVDGPPGIGCPVISSLTGASHVLIVTEPTLSGAHDCERVLELARHFSIKATVCVNKWDLNPKMTERIEKKAEQGGAGIAGRIRYDHAVTAAQMKTMAVVEGDSPVADDIRQLWKSLIEEPIVASTVMS